MTTPPSAPVNGVAPPGAHCFPASSAQHRVWFHDQLQPGRALYNIPIAVRLTGPLDAAVLERALQELIARHETLRTSFARRDDQPVQVVAAALPFRLPLTDLRLLPAAAREAQACVLARQEARRPFDLRHPPLFSIQLLRLADTEHIFLLTVHHIIFDGWSLTVFFRELAALYAARQAGRSPDLPELAVHYGDFTVWQRERFKALASPLAWWREKLAGSPAVLELPTDRPRPAVQEYHGRVETLALPAGVRAPLEALSQREGATLFMTLLAAFQVLLHRHTGQTDLLIGTPVAGRHRPETEALLGLFINTLVLRGDLSGAPTFRELLGRVRATVLDALAHEEVPFEKLVEVLAPERSLDRAPLFQVMFVHERAPLAPVHWPGLRLEQLELDSGTAKFDLTLYVVERADGLTLRAEYDTALFASATIRRLLAHYAELLGGAAARPDTPCPALPLLTAAERRQVLEEWNDTRADYPREATVAGLFEAQVARTPDAVAAVFETDTATYRELNELADALAAHLRLLGIGPGVIVGLCLERSLDLLIGLLAILKTGGAYLPLDPHFPPDRIAYILQDARAPIVLAQKKFRPLLPAEGVRVVHVDTWDSHPPLALPSPAAGAPRRTADDPAYVIYTSGSTGRPKGVVVLHRNVVNFFGGMDRSLGFDPAAAPGCWLAVTTVSFDISVLELLWTLTRGFKVVIQSGEGLGLPAAVAPAAGPARPLDFSLLYFASDGENPDPDRYRLLKEGAVFADRHGFAAVWTPERHFHPFGGLYPNPAVTGAALAVLTERIQIRAGSVVLPLHDPIRVAEEWAVVDNLSRGRAAIAVASGWHDRDFALAPERFARRQEIAWAGLETVRRLWRGGTIRVPGPAGEVEIGIHPRPVQPELPVWITAAGCLETFRQAGALGANVLTHLLGQSLEELDEKIRAYRAARRFHGHDPAAGCVTLMLHTFVGADLAEVRERVRAPLCHYLKSSLTLVRSLARRLEPGTAPETLTVADLNALIDSAFDRYFESSGLFGTPEGCLRLLDRLQALGVGEVACLIDFGVETDAVLASLVHLDRLKQLHRQRQGGAGRPGVAEQIARHGVTHLQCTPSLAGVLAADPAALAALRGLRQLLLGGEALPVPLAARLARELPDRVFNLYGPTETTVWSTVHRLGHVGRTVPIGRPIANTRIYILDRHLQPLPAGLPGELCIGGDSVAAGYLHRPELTAEKFLPDPFSAVPGARLYRTGDLARHLPNGDLEFLGRLDQQVKIRGHRIEPGEIETVLRLLPAVREAVVVAREDAGGDRQLVAYLAAAAPGPAPAELRRHLAAQLPDSMIPSAFVILDRLPLTPNGKIDRRALPAPGAASRPAVNGSGALRDGLEQKIAAIWTEVLKVPHPGADDNFFDLGGHSLRVAQVQAKLRTQLGVALPLLAFFQHPTIRSLARHLGEPPAESRLHQQVARRAERQHAARPHRARPALAQP